MADNSLHHLYERLGAVEQTALASHKRQDRIEELFGETIGEIKADVKTLLAEDNKRKGWMAAAILFASLFGGLASKLFFK